MVKGMAEKAGNEISEAKLREKVRKHIKYIQKKKGMQLLLFTCEFACSDL